MVGCLGLALFVVTVRLESFAELGAEIMDDDDGDDTDGQDTTQQDKANKKKNWQKRFAKAGDLFSLSYTCDGTPSSGKSMAPESKSVKEWRTDITKNYGPTAQLLVGLDLYLYVICACLFIYILPL